MQHNSRWHTLETADQVAVAAYQQILDTAKQAIAEHGTFKLVLAGGSTPEKVYRMLAQADADWAKWYIYYGDERCLPADHADRNSLMATQAFLEKVAIPDAQIFTIPAELGPEQGAKKSRLIWFCWVWVKMGILPVYFQDISIAKMNWHMLFITRPNHRRNAFPSVPKP
jgi:6-phosphogluconolactonase